MKYIINTLLILLLCSACVEKRDLNKNSVIVRIGITPDGLHPTNGNSSVASFVSNYIHQTLVATDLESEEDFPLLLKKLPEPDSTGLLYRYELKEGVKWDDGSPLRVEDVIFSTKLVLCPLTNNAKVRPIYSAVIERLYPDPKDNNVFYVKCKNKHILNKDIIGGLYLMQKSHWDPDGILDDLSFEDLNQESFSSKAEWDDWFNAFNGSDNSYLPKNIVGLGAYQVVEFEKDNYIKLKKKKNWWGEKLKGPMYKANPEEIIFKVIADNSAVYLGIKNQEIDFTQSAGGISKLIRLQRIDYFNESYKSDFVAGYSYSYLGLNMRPDEINNLPLFKDLKVRKAIAHLVPIEEIIEVMYYNKATRQASIVSPLKASCDTTLTFVPYDTEKAKALLAEAGWEDSDGDNIVDKVVNGKKIPLSFKLNYASGGNSKEIVLMMKDAMNRAGVELLPNPMDFNSLYKNAANHTFDAMLGGWLAGSGYSDPTQIWSTESWANKGSNFCGFGNAYTDSLIVAANTSLTKSKHLEAYRALQREIYEQQPYVFLWSAKNPMVVHRRFENTEFYRARPNINLGAFQLKSTVD